MAKAKRPRREPDITRGPSRLKSGWPKDKRAPARGKAAGAPTKPRQQARPANPVPIGTTQSGKPNGAAVDPSTIASSEAPRPKRGRKSKGKVELPEQKLEKRTLSTKEQQETALRAVRLTIEARKRERKLKRETKTERDAIKELRAQAETLETQADQGFELVPEGDLFADSVQGRREPVETIGGGPAALSPAGADEVLRKIAGGNGKHAKQCPTCGSTDHEKHPVNPADATDRCDDAFHGGAAVHDDLTAAATRDLAESSASPTPA